MKNIFNYKKVLFISVDIFIIIVSYVFATTLKFDFNIPKTIQDTVLIRLPIIILIYLMAFIIFKLYSSVWSLSGRFDYINIVLANFISMILSYIFISVTKSGISTGIIVMSSVLVLFGTLGYRMFFRAFKRFRMKSKNSSKENKVNVLIIGAGEAAALLIKEIIGHNELNLNLVGIIDDDKYKQHLNINGVPIIGTSNDIIDISDKLNIDEIIFAIPSIKFQDKKRIFSMAKKTKAKLKTLPGVYELIKDGFSYEAIRDINIIDLLGRREIRLQNFEISNYIENKIILVTGGGGSIGSELCRQITRFKPKKLIIIDIYENGAYDIQNELLKKYPNLDLLVLIASIRDKKKINHIFEKTKPNIVFHAAAHKHVPLMETSPDEAIKNNVFGTNNLVEASKLYNTDKFILVSTDKAVNPTNIMGATKRLCEIIIQNASSSSNHTEFAAVRFGNVMSSNGSVIPLFKKQIEEGGPVTITHQDIMRYFMTIPEAVSLVLIAGSYAKGGEIFILDMGDPVKIYDLAKNMIQLFGLKPNEDIEIEIIGLRPGEKLYEELLMKEEGIKSTSNEFIFVVKSKIFEKEKLNRDLVELKKLIYSDDFTEKDVQEKMSQIVTNYKIKN